MRKLCGLAFLMLTTLAVAQQDFSKVEIKVTKVAGTVYMLVGAGGNIGVSVGDDGIVVVDDQYAPLAPKIQAALKGITDKPVRFIINTHWHGDHTGGNLEFGKAAPIIAQENVRKRLASGGKVGPLGKVDPAPKGALPIITFSERASVHLNGEDIRAIHFPHGHTDGDSVIFFTQSNVVHMGDDFFNGIYPFIDIDSGGSVKGMIVEVEKVLNQAPADAKFIAGHGPLGTADDVRAFVEMLKGTSGAVEQALKQGKSLDQMKQEKILAKWDSWGKGFLKADQFLEILYNDLSQKRSGHVHYMNHGHADERPSN